MIKSLFKIIGGFVALLLPTQILNPAEFMVFMAVFGFVFYAYLSVSLGLEGVSEIVKKVTKK